MYKVDDDEEKVVMDVETLGSFSFLFIPRAQVEDCMWPGFSVVWLVVCGLCVS